MKANLTIADRFAILGILPAEGNFATAKLVRELREQLSLTEAEIKEYGVVQVSEGHAEAIKNAKTDVEALAIATKIYGAVNAQRVAIGIRNGSIESNQIAWTKGDKTTEMEFGEFATEMIKNLLIKLEKEKKLDIERHYSIYEQFVEVK